MSFMLGSIRATLGLDESNFVRGMISAQTAAGIFGQGVVNFVNNPLLGMVGIMRNAVVQSAAFVRETAFLNQEFARMADRTGASIRTITGLRNAYDDFGLTVQDLEKTFSELAKKIEETKTSEDARKRFAALGVELTNSDGRLRSLDEILRSVSDGLAGMEDRTQRMAIAQQLFGDKGVQLLSILGQGSQAMEETILKAERMGYVLGEEGARQSNRLASSLDDLGRSIQGVKESVATAFIEGFIGELSDADLASDGLAKTIRTALVPAAKEIGRELGVILDLLQQITPLLSIANSLRLTSPPIMRVVDLLNLPESYSDATEIGTEIGNRVAGRRVATDQQQRQLRAME